jgi:Lacto-N-biose phosphorylase.
MPVEAGMNEDLEMLVEKWGADAVRDSDGTKLPDFIYGLRKSVFYLLPNQRRS